MASLVQVDFTGKMAFIVVIVNSSGYGWAIAHSLVKTNATIIIRTWPPVLKIFQMGLKKGSFDDDSTLPGRGNVKIAKMCQESSTCSWILIILTRLNMHSYLCLNTGLPVQRRVQYAG